MIAALGAAAVPASAFGAVPAEASPRAAQCAPGGPDFNGDRCGDVVVADPDATVAGKLRAGRINVLYGGEGGVHAALLTQGGPGVGESPESDDRFGAVVQTMDINNDGYADLVVGVPSESVGSADDAGVIHVIFGSAGGLGGGRTGIVLRQGILGIPGTSEAGDRFGAAVAVNRTTGEFGTWPAVAFGAPGEDVGSAADAGAAGVVTFDPSTGEVATAARITQNSPGISGTAEAGDRFGAAVELFQGPGGFGCGVTGVKGFTLVVGVPGEDLNGKRDAGMVHLARNLTTDMPLSQDSPGVDGGAETGDQFGAGLALSSFCEHDGPSHIKLAVGVPTEDIGAAGDAGMVHLFATDDDELPLPQRWSVNQNSAGVGGTAETGDRFGSVLALGGPWRDGLGEPLVVGLPGEDIGTAKDAGGVQVFGDAASAPGNGDVFLSQSNTGEAPQAADHFGAALTTRNGHLLVGAPDDVTHSKGAVHGIAWPAVFGTPTPGLLFVPGRDGIAADAVRFGAGLT
ncbi:FG-GAP repeat protein [Actinomadura alba]|uniref:FG-GAP repeat protein n=1 Tax=Actinomadura alba TaxID=406431 RepID=A0ABR7LP86_9ACTN|nr:FG-GAP repeat protein [Actinomadura alba]MBC6466302.1 FG-GAP repeat protein [Actinomadura alba]